MRLTLGTPYMAKHGRWRLSVVYVEGTTRVGVVMVRRWSAKGKKWSQPRPLAGGICRKATELDCTARGLPSLDHPSWARLAAKLAKGQGTTHVDVPWGLSVSFNYAG